ncbi:MAG: hypothetical protein ACFE9R_20885, partial [Candidatus Hermodarchaeota archaeon]
MINNSFHIINKNDPNFQKLIIQFKSEFERIREKTPIENVSDNKSLPNTVYITKPDLFHKFGELKVLKHNPELIERLQSLLYYTEEKLEISINIDFAQYGFRVGDLYNKIFENVFPYYLFWNSKWKNILLRLINEWRLCFSREDFLIEIIIPLKGFNIKEDSFPFEDYENIRTYRYDFYNHESVKVSLKSFPNYYFLNFESFTQGEKNNFVYEGISKDIVKYGIFANKRIPFGINKHIKQKFLQIELWDYIKKVTIVVSLEGTLLKFGAPFYKFPWWFSNQILQNFEFYFPDWMNRRYMNPNAYSKLIPDIQEEFEFKETRGIGGNLATFFERDLETWISKPLNPTWELRNQFIQNKNLDRLDLKKVQKVFSILNKKSSKVNFWDHSFILDRYIKLSQRNKIEDVILDASSILEALFIGGSQTELSYRLKLNVAGLIAKNLDEFRNEFDYF